METKKKKMSKEEEIEVYLQWDGFRDASEGTLEQQDNDLRNLGEWIEKHRTTDVKKYQFTGFHRRSFKIHSKNLNELKDVVRSCHSLYVILGLAKYGQVCGIDDEVKEIACSQLKTLLHDPYECGILSVCCRRCGDYVEFGTPETYKEGIERKRKKGHYIFEQCTRKLYIV